MTQVSSRQQGGGTQVSWRCTAAATKLLIGRCAAGEVERRHRWQRAGCRLQQQRPMHSTPVQPPQSLLFSLYFNLIIVEELDLITTAFLVWHNTLNLILIPRHCKTSLFFSDQSGNRCLNASQHSSVCFLQKRTSYDSCLCSSKRALLWFFACLRDTSLCFLHEGLLVYFASD